jgi:nitroreductase
MSLLENLQWRYATKSYDPTKKVSRQDLNKILEAARLAPTSSGLQPYRVLVVSNQELKQKLSANSLNPDSMINCSHVLVLPPGTIIRQNVLTKSMIGSQKKEDFLKDGSKVIRTK